MEKKEWMGIWWVASNPQRKFIGKLKYSPSLGLTIEAIGDGNEIEFLASHKKAPVVHGHTEDAKAVTLFDCSIDSMGGTSYGYQEYEVFSQFAIFGVLLDDQKKLKFSEISAKYLFLRQWVDAKPIKSSMPWKNENKGEASFQYPEEVLANIDDETCNVTLSSSMSYSGFGNSNSLHWKYDPIFKFSFSESKEFECFQDKLFKTSQLITFLSGQPSSLVSLLGVIEGDVVKILCPIHPQSKAQDFNPVAVLVPFRSIEKSFSAILTKWFGIQATLDSALNQFFSVYFEQGQYLETTFLNLARSLEVYHRKKIGGGYYSVEEYEPILEELIGTIPQSIRKDCKESLKASLKYGYQYSFRRRLKELFEYIDDNIKTCFLHDQKNIISNVKNTRDYFTHYDGQGVEHLSFDDLLMVCDQMKLMFICLLLSELEISVDAAGVSIHRHFSKLVPEKYRFSDV